MFLLEGFAATWAGPLWRQRIYRFRLRWGWPESCHPYAPRPGVFGANFFPWILEPTGWWWLGEMWEVKHVGKLGEIHGKGPVALIFSTQSRPEISHQVSAETLLWLRKKKTFTRVQWILNIFEPLLENFTAVRGGGLADYSRNCQSAFL